eukprot:802348-Ditylum_brightwellii.AAC.1
MKTPTSIEESPEIPSQNDFETKDEIITEDVINAIEEISEAEEDALNVGESILTKALNVVEDSVKFSLGRLFGNDETVDDEELEEMAKEVAAKLDKETIDELEVRADEITDAEIEKIEDDVEESEKFGESVGQIESEIMQEEEEAIDI